MYLTVLSCHGKTIYLINNVEYVLNNNTFINKDICHEFDEIQYISFMKYDETLLSLIFKNLKTLYIYNFIGDKYISFLYNHPHLKTLSIVFNCYNIIIKQIFIDAICQMNLNQLEIIKGKYEGGKLYINKFISNIYLDVSGMDTYVLNDITYDVNFSQINISNRIKILVNEYAQENATITIWSPLDMIKIE